VISEDGLGGRGVGPGGGGGRGGGGGGAGRGGGGGAAEVGTVGPGAVPLANCWTAVGLTSNFERALLLEVFQASPVCPSGKINA
jgi:hypothetical protein